MRRMVVVRVTNKRWWRCPTIGLVVGLRLCGVDVDDDRVGVAG